MLAGHGGLHLTQAPRQRDQRAATIVNGRGKSGVDHSFFTEARARRECLSLRVQMSTSRIAEAKYTTAAINNQSLHR